MAEPLKPQIMTRLPADTKSTGGRRVDFVPSAFDQLIGTKGTKHWWSRATICPCEGNTQTDQVDPICSLCNGKGWLSFLPDPELDTELDAYGYPIELNEAKTAVSIRVLIQRIRKDPQDFETFGRWILGTGEATVQSANRIGWRDRLTSRDATLSYTQLIKCDGGTEIIVTGIRSTVGLHTPVAFVNMLRSEATIYKQDRDFVVTDDGTILWTEATPPDADTQLSLHAEFFPVWVVMDHPFGSRDTYVIDKAGDKHKRLPPNATVKLDFLVDD